MLAHSSSMSTVAFYGRLFKLNWWIMSFTTFHYDACKHNLQWCPTSCHPQYKTRSSRQGEVWSTSGLWPWNAVGGAFLTRWPKRGWDFLTRWMLMPTSSEMYWNRSKSRLTAFCYTVSQENGITEWFFLLSDIMKCKVKGWSTLIGGTSEMKSKSRYM